MGTRLGTAQLTERTLTHSLKPWPVLAVPLATSARLLVPHKVVNVKWGQVQFSFRRSSQGQWEGGSLRESPLQPLLMSSLSEFSLEEGFLEDFHMCLG